MNTEKNGQNTTPKNKTSFVAIYILGFIVSLLFEFYWITYFPYDYFMLFGIGLILCILGYLSIDGILEIIHDINKKKSEQNELLIKASKAIYLATKKNSANADKKQLQNLKALDAIINRAVENIQVPRTSSANPEELQQLVSELSKTNEQLSRELENVQALQLAAQTSPIPETPLENDFISDISIDNEDNDITTAPLGNFLDDTTPVSEEQVDTMITEDVNQAEILVSNTMQDRFSGNITENFSETIETPENNIELSDISDMMESSTEPIEIPQTEALAADSIEIPMEVADSPAEELVLPDTVETMMDISPEINEFSQPEEILPDTIAMNNLAIASEVTAIMDSMENDSEDTITTDSIVDSPEDSITTDSIVDSPEDSITMDSIVDSSEEAVTPDSLNAAPEVSELQPTAFDTDNLTSIEPSDNPNRTMTAEEIAALFANL